MYKPFIENSKGKEAYLFIPDFHSLTSVHDKETLQKNKKRLLIEVFSLLGDDSNVVVFEQSKVRRINDITWVLSSVTPYSLMLRAHSFKDSKNKNSEVNMATFNYPILMTSDIIAYDIDIVPVGKDQKQHVEFARDIAENFNKTYKQEVFKLPEPLIEKTVETIPGTDGRKMSKSYDNFIGVFDDEKLLKKKIMSIQTDDTPLEEPKDPDTCNVFALINFFASEQRQEEIRKKYLAGNYGYGHAKLELLEILLEYF
jgi:tryptophanyl-tRNA synthetase